MPGRRSTGWSAVAAIILHNACICVAIVMAAQSAAGATHDDGSGNDPVVQPGDLIVTSGGTQSLLVYGGQSGAFTTALLPHAPSLNSFIVDDAGTVWNGETSFWQGSPQSGWTLRTAPLELAGVVRVDAVAKGPGNIVFVGVRTSAGGFRVYRYNTSTHTLTLLIDRSNSGDTIAAMHFGPAANAWLFIGLRNSRNIERYNSTNGAFINTVINGAFFGNFRIKHIDVSAGGDLLVMDTRFELFRFDMNSGNLIDIFIDPAQAELVPTGFHVGPGNDIFVSGRDPQGNGIFRFNGATGAFMQRATDVFGGSTALVAFDFLPNEDIVATFESIFSLDPMPLIRFDAQSGDMEGVYLAYPGNMDVRGIDDVTIGFDAMCYASTSHGNAVIRADLETGNIDIPLIPRDEIGISSIEARSDLMLYAPSTLNGSVQRYNLRTGVFVDAFIEEGELLDPQRMLFRHGMVWVLDQGNRAVVRFSQATGAYIDDFIIHGFPGDEVGMVFLPGGDLLISNPNGDSVRRFDGSTGADLGNFIAPGADGLDYPADLAFGPDGSLYVASRNTHQILRYNGQSGAFIDVFVERCDGGLVDPTSIAFAPAAVPVTATLTDASVVFGTHISGTVNDVRTSDNVYFRGRSQFGFLSSEPNKFEFRIGAQTAVSNPVQFHITSEGRFNNPAGSSRWRLQNWSLNRIETIWVHSLGISEWTEFVSGIDAIDHVRNTDGRIELTIRQVVVATFSVSGFISYTDFVRVQVLGQ
ncbi:MAG: hypothetical protein ACR2GY_04715 [Phycisphaerales bacterium]